MEERFHKLENKKWSSTLTTEIWTFKVATIMPIHSFTSFLEEKPYALFKVGVKWSEICKNIWFY